MKRVDHWLLAIMVNLIAAPVLSQQQDVCGTSPWHVVASIERIEPAGESVRVDRRDGSTREAGLFHCLVAGEKLVLQGRVTWVELFIGGAPRRVSAAESPYEIAGGAHEQVSAAARALLDWWRLRPRETGAAIVKPRTKGPGTMQVTAAAGLASAPRQWLLEDTRSLALGWRATQAAAWVVRADCLDGGPSSRAQVFESAEAFYATLAFDTAPSRRCSVRLFDDYAKAVLELELEPLDGATLPRPPGLEGDWRRWEPQERIAWAAWALSHAPPQWHLQALSWLHEHRGNAWLAGHLFFRTINSTAASR